VLGGLGGGVFTCLGGCYAGEWIVYRVFWI